MRRLGFVVALAGLIAMAAPGAAFAAGPKAGACVNGHMAGGTYSSFTIRGVCNIAFGATVHVTGNLTVAPGASLDDHGSEMWLKGEIHVGGNVIVGQGAVLGLGWNSPGGDGTLGPDTVGGSIVASQPRALQIGELTIGGNLVSSGGGVASTALADFRNFPVKDNVVHGNIVINGWHGGWIGLIRNTVGGNVIFTNNVSASSDAGPGTDSDSSEIMGSDLTAVGGPVIPQTIKGNLICFGNVPAAQVNPGDGGAPSVVGGKGIGECAGLTQ